MYILTSQSLTASYPKDTTQPDGWIMSRGTEQHVKAGSLTISELQLLPAERSD